MSEYYIRKISRFEYNYTYNNSTWYYSDDISRFDNINGIILNYGINCINSILFYFESQTDSLAYKIKFRATDYRFVVEFSGGPDDDIHDMIKLFCYAEAMNYLYSNDIMSTNIIPRIDSPFTYSGG